MQFAAPYRIRPNIPWVFITCLVVMFSLSVILVSITNQKVWGNMSFGLSLIGPRMSSVGVGWMLLQSVTRLMRYDVHSDQVLI